MPAKHATDWRPHAIVVHNRERGAQDVAAAAACQLARARAEAS